MAGTSKTRGNTEKNDGADADELLALTPEQREEEDTEAVIAAEFGLGDSNVTWAVKVWRAAAKGEPEPYLFTCSPNELPIIDRLRDEYGTGTYRVRVFKNNRVYRYFTVVVEARKSAPAPVVAAPPSDNLSGVVTQALDRQTALIERLLNERPRNQGNGMDGLSMITTVIGALSQFKELFGIGGQTNQVQQVDLFLKGVEAARELSGGGEKGESGFMDVLRDLLKSPMVEKLLEGAASAMPAMPQRPALPMQPGIGEIPVPPAAPIPSTPQPAPQPTAPQAEGHNEPANQHTTPPEQQAAMVFHNLKYLATKAAANADVELYADWVMDNIPAEMLMQLVQEPNALDIMATTVPETAPYRAWFAALLGLIKEYLTEPSGDAQDAVHVQPAAATSTVSAS